MRAPHFILTAMGFSLLSAHASAEDVAPEPVVISATQVPTPESQVASSVTVITGEEIELKQQRTLPDVLKTVPGTQPGPDWRPRRANIHLHARHQSQSHKGFC